MFVKMACSAQVFAPAPTSDGNRLERDYVTVSVACRHSQTLAVVVAISRSRDRNTIFALQHLQRLLHAAAFQKPRKSPQSTRACALHSFSDREAAESKKRPRIYSCLSKLPISVTCCIKTSERSSLMPGSPRDGHYRPFWGLALRRAPQFRPLNFPTCRLTRPHLASLQWGVPGAGEPVASLLGRQDAHFRSSLLVLILACITETCHSHSFEGNCLALDLLMLFTG